jgi:hypothetical protein
MNRLEDTAQWPPIVAQLRTQAILEVARDHGVTPGQISSALKRIGLTRKPIRREQYVVSSPTAPPTLTLLRSSRVSGDINWMAESKKSASTRMVVSEAKTASIAGATMTPVFRPNPQIYRTSYERHRRPEQAQDAVPLVWSVQCHDGTTVYARGADLLELGEALRQSGVMQVLSVQRLGRLLT